MAFQIKIINGVVQTCPLDQSEKFQMAEDGPLASSTIGEFWQWAFSDIVGNTERGALAEFIVARALRSKRQTRNEWAAFDLETPAGIRVEVKSSAYLQSWYQKSLSSPRFSIKKSLMWIPESNTFIGERQRHSDIYVFCLLAHRGAKSDLNPLNLAMWEFYVLKTNDIDRLYGSRESISIEDVCKHSFPYTAAELSRAVEAAGQTIKPGCSLVSTD
jgi:hypothetical protein